ncbi:TPA: AAA family ATPase [Providencia rettgeri]|nr:AAA family ATPase [Providencia rettgeri]HEM7507429.1 AAA family ATPase [Providencia rettgeri]HEM8267873.1 AAA family ATPase [Providencia rettgeri]
MNDTDYPIEFFEVRGLYGYKNITLNFKNKTNIFVSENGVGKTTIINFLYGVLKLNFEGIYVGDIEFDCIKIKFTNHNKVFSLAVNDIDTLYSIESDIKDLLGKIRTINSRIDDYNGSQLFNLYSEIIGYKRGDYDKNKAFKTLFGISLTMVKKRREEENEYNILNLKDFLIKSLSSGMIDFLKIHRKNISNKEILFMPTYRRLEKIPSELLDAIDEIEATSDSIFNEFGYGLNDVDYELNRITNSIERKSTNEYRELSITMLDDIVNNESENKNIKESELPELKDLTRFLKRVRIGNGRTKRSRELNLKSVDKLIGSLGKIYEEKKVDEHKYLKYFLSKLNLVIKETKEQEYKIEQFINVCNGYLSSSGDIKYIEINPNNFSVRVIDKYSQRIIEFDELSSGEKQIISLMAKLYLSNERDKIIIIDEPELSLSIKWQQKLLPDMDSASVVKQIVAITHSPFIFDNNLESNATELIITRDEVE